MSSSTVPALSAVNNDFIQKILSEGHHAKTRPTAALKASAIVTPVFKLPDDVTLKVRTSVLTVMTAFGTSSDTTASSWKSWLLSYLCMAYPEVSDLVTFRGTDEFRVVELPALLVSNWTSVFDNIANEVEGAEKTILPCEMFPELDNPELSFELICCNELNGLYCYAALLMFLCGKTISDLNREAITVKRPKALMQEFQTADSAFILTGAGRLSSTAHSSLNSAWTAIADPRISIVEHFSQAIGEGKTPYRIMSQVMKLLALTGMNYVKLIIRLLEAAPFVTTMPALQADLRAFKESVARLSVIQPHFRPYYKLAYGNDCTIFRRREMPGLVSIAIVYGSTYNETLKNYRIEAGYGTLLQKFQIACRENGLEFERSSDQAIVTHAL